MVASWCSCPPFVLAKDGLALSYAEPELRQDCPKEGRRGKEQLRHISKIL